MIQFIRTTGSDAGFRLLVPALDAELRVRDGKDHAFYAAFNKSDHIQHVVVGYDGSEPVGCGAFKPFSEETLEIKRMYVLPSRRGEGIATQVLNELERWASELHYTKCVLETGKNQPEAIALYNRRGYSVIPNYGQYIGVENSVCFEKILQVPKMIL